MKNDDRKVKLIIRRDPPNYPIIKDKQTVKKRARYVISNSNKA